MATENPGPIVSREAGTNVTNKRFVVEVAGNIVNRPAAIGVQVNGVCAMVSAGFTGTPIAAGDEVPVCKSGVVIMEAGAAIADNTKVMTDAVGRPITWDDGDGHYAVGISRSAPSGAGKDVSIELFAENVQNLGTDLT